MTHKTYRITKITKGRIQSYIRFELDGNVEFNDKEQSFIFCSKKYPFDNCQIDDEIEIDLIGARCLNTNSYHDGIIRKRVSRNVLVDDYNRQQQDEEQRQLQQLQAQKQKSLHKMKVALDTFYNVLEPLEEYIEKSGNYPNFIDKRQIYRKSIQDSEGLLENDEDLFLSNLYIFARTFHGKPEFFMKVIQEDFYKWINAVGITAENSSEELKHFLVEINNILEGNDEKIVKESVERNKNIEIDPKEMVGIFAGIQNPLNKNRWQRKELEGRKWREISEENRLKGDADLGKQEFEKIKVSVSIPHENFRLRYFGERRSTQQKTSFEIIQDIKNIPQNWRLDKIATEIERRGRAEKQEFVLIHCSARLNDFDPQTGKLNFNDNSIYKWNSFKVQQKFEIKNTLSENRTYLDRTYLTDDEIDFVIKEFADKPSVWRTEMIEGQEYLIHNSAQIKKNEIGTLLHEKGKFSNQDWAEVKEIEELNKQYGITLRKLKNEIPLEFQETHETLDIWAKELEKKLLINSIRKNVDEWEVRKEVVELDFNKDEVLIRKTTKINVDEDYDLTGGLINRSNKFYRKDYFDDKELAEINSIFNNYKITEKINQDKNNWMIATVGVENSYEVVLNKETGLSDGGKSLNKNGEYYKREQFSDWEWKAIKASFDSSQNQQKSVNELILSENQRDNKDISRGKIFGILGIIVALIIGSVIVMKKRLFKK